MDKRLERQLIRLYGTVESIPADCKSLIKTVNQTYFDFQEEYELIERSLDISSKELTKLNQKLREDIDVKNRLTSTLQGEAEVIEKTVQIRTQELSFERSKLEKITQNMKTGALLVDKLGDVIFINDAAKKFIRFYGATYDGILQKMYVTFTGYPFEEYIQKSLSGETLELTDVQVDGLIFTILFQHTPNEDGHTGILLWIDDVTEEKMLERAKSELVAVASHQLRTPLTITKGNTEILLDESYGVLTTDQHDIIEQTHTSNEKMILLVNQMLDINKIEQGDFSVKLSLIEPIKILEDTITNLTPFAVSKNVSLEYITTQTDIVTILGNNTRLYQVFQNIIDNAIKYSSYDRGAKVEIPKVVVSTSVSETLFTVTIIDQGIGIPENEQSKIFGRFFRASNAEDTFIDGTGLGLHMVKSIVESSKGNISFTSTQGQGTIFTLIFPLIKK